MLLSAERVSAAVISWVGPVSGNWSDSTKWDLGRAPLPGDTVLIHVGGVYTVTLDVSASVDLLDMGVGPGTTTLAISGTTLTLTGGAFVDVNGVVVFSGGSISSAGSFTVAGVLDWQSGSLTGTGPFNIDPTGDVNINGAGVKTLDGVEMRNKSTASSWNGTGPFIIANGGRLWNESSGTITATATGIMSASGVGINDFQNDGTLVVAGGVGIDVTISVELSNTSTGTISISSGDLVLTQSSSNSGSISGGGPTERLRYFSGTHSWDAGGSLGFTTIILETGATVDATAATFVGPIEINGTLTGVGNVTFGGFSEWKGGTLSGSGLLTIDSDGSLTISGAVNHFLDGKTLRNEGNFTWSGNGVISMFNAAQIVNTVGHTFSVLGDGQISYGGGAAVLVDNRGSILKSVGTATDILVPASNSGVIDCLSGEINFSQLANGGALNGTGKIKLSSGAHAFNLGTSIGVDQLELHPGGTLDVNVLSTIPTAATFSFLGGTIQGPGEFRIEGIMDWDAGTVQGSGPLVVTNAGALNIAGTTDVTINGKTVSAGGGGIDWAGTEDIVLINGAVFEINTTGTFNFSSTGVMLDAGGPPSEFRNKGSSTGISPASTTFSARVNNTGSIGLVTGRLILDSSASHASSGSISGSPSTFLRISGGTLTTAGNIGVPAIELPGGTLAVASTLTGVTSIHINGGTFNLLNDLTSTAAVTFDSGFIAGTGDLALNGSVAWNGGNVMGTGTLVLSNAALAVLTGPALKVIDGKPVEVRGILNVASGGDLQLKNAASLTTLGGTIDLQGDFSVQDGGGASSLLNIQSGFFKKSLGAGTTIVSVPFSSSGTITVSQGTLQLNAGSTLLGAVNGAVGTVLDLHLGNHSMGGAISIAVPTIQHNGGGNLTLNTVVALPATTSLDFSTGKIDGPGQLFVSGTMNWSSGTLEGSGSIEILSSANLNMNGVGTKILNGKPLMVSGTASWTGGDIQLANAALLACNTGAVFQTTVSKSILNGGGAASSVVNGGNFVKSADPGTTLVQVEFHNSGLVDVQAGTLELEGNSFNFGAINGLAGTTLRYDGGTHTVEPGGSYAIPMIAVNAPLSINTPTILPGSISVELLNLGNISGSSVLEVSGALDWKAGQMSGSSQTTMKPGSTLTLSLSGLKQLDARRLNIQGSATWLGNNWSVGNGAIIDVQSGATLTVMADVQLNHVGGIDPRIQIAGTLRKTAGPGTLRIEPMYQNSGLIQIDSGSMQFTLSGTNLSGSTFDANPGTYAEFSGGSHLFSAGCFVDAAELRFPGGTTDFNVAPTGLPVTTVSGGTVNFNQPTTLSTLALSSGTACGSADTTINGLFMWSGGNVSGAGVSTIAAGGIQILGGGSKFLDSRRLVLNGTSAWSGAGNIEFSNAGTIDNNGLFRIQSSGSMSQFSGPLGLFQNDGEVSLEILGGLATAINIQFLNTPGSTGLSMRSGTILTSGANFANNSTVKAFLSGSVAGTGYGQIAFAGAATLAGNFALELAAPFNPGIGEVFTPITFGSSSGVFGTYTGLNQGLKGTFTGNYTPTSFFLAAAGPSLGATFIWNGSRSSDWFDANNWTPVGVPGLADDAIINSGTVVMNAVTTVKRLTLNGGVLDGSGFLDIGTQFNWTGGDMNGPGVTTLMPGGSGVISGPADKTLRGGRTLRNLGAMAHIDGTLKGQESALIDNLNSFEIQNDLAMLVNPPPPAPSFVNSGTLVKNTAAGISRIDWNFSNSGVLSPFTGRIELNGSGTSPGIFRPMLGAKVDFVGGIQNLAGATFEGAGASCLHPAGTIQVPIGTTATVTTGANFKMMGGLAEVSGTLQIDGAMEWSGGTLEDPGLTRVAAGAALTVESGNMLLGNSHAILNLGAMIVNDGAFLDGNSSVVLTNSGVMSFTGITSSFTAVSGAPRLRNEGTFLMPVGSDTFSTDFDVENFGNLQIEAGTFEILGNYAPPPVALHTFVIRGTTPLTDFGRITVGGLFTFDGTITLLPSGFSPTPPQTFTIFEYFAYAGPLADLHLPIGPTSEFLISRGGPALIAAVVPLGSAPTISATPNTSGIEDLPVVVNFTVGDTEDGPNPLIPTARSSNTALIPNANLIFSGAGASRTLTIVPLANQIGVTTIELVVTDTSSKSTTNTFTVTITPFNDPPTLDPIANVTVLEDPGPQTVPLAGISSGAIDEVQVLTVTATSSDPTVVPHPTVTYSSPAAIGSLSFTPVLNAVGTVIITVTVTDDLGASASRIFSVTITPVNDSPTILPISNATILEDAGLQTVPLAGITSGAANETQVLSVIATSSNPALIPAPAIGYTSPGTIGSLSYSPAANLSGSSLITVIVNDDAGGTTSTSFTVTVLALNDPPTLDPISPLTVSEDSGLQTIPLTGITSGAPGEIQVLTVLATSSATSIIPHPTVTYTSPASLGSISFTPVPNAFGVATITVTVLDDLGGSVTRVFPVTVDAVNDAPSFNPLTNLSLPEDEPIFIYSFGGISAGSGESQNLTVTAVSANTSILPHPTVAYTSPGATANLGLSPVPNANGTVVITVTVTDDGGVALGGVNSFTRTFTLDVSSLNDPPDVSAPPTLSAVEDTPVLVPGIIVSDIDGGVLPARLILHAPHGTLTFGSFAGLTFLPGGANGTTNVVAEGTLAQLNSALATLNYRAFLGYSGPDLLSLMLNDLDPDPLIDTDSIVITVAPKNTPPTISAISNQSADEDTTLSVPFTMSDLETPAGLTPSATSANHAIVAPGGLTFEGSGATRTLKIAPVPNAVGTVTITLTVTDSGGASSLRTFNVALAPVNDAPELAPIGSVLAEEDGLQVFVPISLIDPDTIPTSLSLSLNISEPPVVSISVLGDGSLRTLVLTPLPNADGESEVTVKVSDGLLSTSRSFKARVLPSNDPPVMATVPPQSIDEDTTLTFDLAVSDVDSPIGFMTYDFDSDHRALVDLSSFQVTRIGTGARIGIKPLPNASGLANISLVVKDNSGVATSQKFQLNVRAIDDPPSVQKILNQKTKESTPVPPIDLVVGDVDTDLGQLKFTVNSSNASLIPPGNVEVSGSGSSRQLKIRPTDNQFGSTLLTLGVSDGTSTTTISFEVFVEFVNQPPEIAAAAELVLNEDQPPTTVEVGVGDSEDPSTTLKLSVDSSNEELIPTTSIQIEGIGINRLVKFAPARNRFGESILTLKVEDRDGGVTELPMKVIVNPVNDLPKISEIKEVRIAAETVSSPIEFTVEDEETRPGLLKILGKSSDPSVVPDAGLVVSGEGGNKNLRITPAPGKSGTLIVTLTVVDEVGAEASVKFDVSVVPNKPEIEAPPAPLAVAVGKDAEFVVVAKGIGLNYRWFFNQTPIPDQKESRLLLKNVTFEDSGRYSVEVSNLGGSVRSQPVPLQVVIPPTIVTPPSSQTATAGDHVSFSVAPNGTAPLSFEWFFNSTKIPGAEGRTLQLRSVTRESAGTYFVRVSNLAGDASSDPVVLTVLVPPSIGEQPQGQTVRAGERVTLRVRVTGDGPFFYQWRLNGVNIPGETSDTLVRESVRPEDSGSYTVVVRSPSGTTTSDPALIIVLVDETVFADNFVDRVALPGPSGSLKGSSALATAEPGEPFHAGRRPARSVWARWVAPSDGIATFNTTGSSFDTVLAIYLGSTIGSITAIASDEDSGGFLTSLVRFNVSAGTEYAIAVDGVGGVGGTVVVSWSFQSTPTRVPRITSTPADQTVLEGGTATFNVTAVDDGGAPLTYQWFREGFALPGQTTRTLVINNVGVPDVARYQVEVSNGAAAARSAPAKLVIGVNEGGTAATGVSPEDKFADATPGGAGGTGALARPRGGLNRAGGPPIGGFESQVLIKAGTAVARGYSGSQVFNSFGSTTEANEPNHCGVIGGASQWFTYQAEADGQLLISTGGSDFNTVLAVYTGNAEDFSSLSLVACDDNSGPNGATSLVRFTATAGTLYYIAVDGLNGATGRVKLSYQLDVPLRLQSSASAGEGQPFGLVLAAQQSGSYTLQASTNMLDWFGVATTNLVVPRGATVSASLRDTNSVSDIFRFYRAVFVPVP